jgi:hypothetical protein
MAAVTSPGLAGRAGAGQLPDRRQAALIWPEAGHHVYPGWLVPVSASYCPSPTWRRAGAPEPIGPLGHDLAAAVAPLTNAAKPGNA